MPANETAAHGPAAPWDTSRSEELVLKASRAVVHPIDSSKT